MVKRFDLISRSNIKHAIAIRRTTLRDANYQVQLVEPGRLQAPGRIDGSYTQRLAIHDRPFNGGDAGEDEGVLKREQRANTSREDIP